MGQGDKSFIDRVCASSRDNLQQSLAYRQFLQSYFDDFRDTAIFCNNTMYLSDMSADHWDLMNQRQSDIVISTKTIVHPNDTFRYITQFYVVMLDMPFIVDTTKMSLRREGLNLLATHNAVFEDKENKLSLVCVIVDAIDDGKIKVVVEQLRSCLNDVQMAVSDWNEMRDLMDKAVASWRHARAKGIVDPASYATHIEFFHWLRLYFTFLGTRTYSLDKTGTLKYVGNSGLGVMSGQPRQIQRALLHGLPSQLSESDVSLFYISKTKTDSTIHRPTITDMVGLRMIGPSGDIVGELRIVGLFTSDAFDSDPTKIPLLREKVAQVARGVFTRSRYSSKMLQHIIKNYPREELFQASIPELKKAALKTLALYDQPREYVIARRDPFDHYYSCLVFVPRDKFNTAVKNKIESILIDFFNGSHATNQPFFDESLLVRVHYIIQISDTSEPLGSMDELNEKVSLACTTWSEAWQNMLYHRYEFFKAKHLIKYLSYFNDSYQSIFTPVESVNSIVKLEETLEKRSLQIAINFNDQSQEMSLCLYQYAERSVVLVDVLSILSMVGLLGQYEQTCKLDIDGAGIYVSRYQCRVAGDCPNLKNNLDRLEEDLVAVMSRQYESDVLNKLLLTCDITLSDIVILRSYIAYLLQLKYDAAVSVLQNAVVDNPEVAVEFVSYFNQKFNPAIESRSFRKHEANISRLLEGIKSIEEDRCLRAIFTVLKATLRTNCYLADKECFAIKVWGKKVPFMPSPASMFEIYMYSRSFESIHIRADRFARGGIRWSDRVDFRTEISLLEKAQTVKNALIVPTGAKGGFHIKEYEGDIKQVAKDVYCSMVRTLLSLTDNVSSAPIRNNDVVAYDEIDTYLVVAADKGTARFSDLANEIALRRHFWLGDAFASGGEHGYDHKEMGITAKGAWCSLEWYFCVQGRALDKPFSVVGIGDMSGDVFGNGMLLSRQIKLVAAFNHKHIFIDPNPDPEKSFEERDRLFKLPSSQWSDYDSAIISAGGGVYERSEKVIKLSKQAMTLLGCTTDRLGPNELISTILTAQVDVIWNGGIGTYVKSSSESAQDVDDVVNRSCRVDANSLRAQMVVEGGNLGFTQHARVEFAKRGGLINTDFIDNSAGVDCSDHEVNIKILMEPLIANNSLSEEERNTLLEAMKPSVESMVLSHNTDQNITISLALYESQVRKYTEKYDVIVGLISSLEKNVHLNVKDEYLPSESELKMRALSGRGLTRPELAVLLSYLKIYVKSCVEQFDDLDGEFYRKALLMYYPEILQSKFREQILCHPLRKSIIALNIGHRFVSDTGIFFLMNIRKHFNCSTHDVMSAYIVVREVLDLDSQYVMIKRVCRDLRGKNGVMLLASYQKHVCAAIKWVLKTNVTHDKNDFFNFLQKNDIASNNVVPYFGKKVSESTGKLFNSLCEHIDTYDMSRILNMPYINYQLNIARASFILSVDLKKVVSPYFMVSDFLKLQALRKKFSKQQERSKWDVMQRAVIEAELDECMVHIVVEFMKHHEASGLSLKKSLSHWSKINEQSVRPWLDFMLEVSSSQQYDFSTFALAVQRLKLFVESCSKCDA